MMNVGFIQNGNNVKTGHKNNNNAVLYLLRIRYHTELQESHTDYKTNQTLQTTPTTHKQTRPTSTTNNNTYTMVCMS
jgi:hypothetical protein